MFVGEFFEMNASQSDELETRPNKAGEKKDYQPPKIVYREALEVSAAVCTTGKAIIGCGSGPQS
jgi:hypothetical protein